MKDPFALSRHDLFTRAKPIPCPDRQKGGRVVSLIEPVRNAAETMSWRTIED